MAAGNTYTPIANTVLGSPQGSYTFSSISQSYTDLILVIDTFGSLANCNVRINNDSGTNYYSESVGGDGSSRYSGRTINDDRMYGTYTSGYPQQIWEFFNYSNTTTRKPVIWRNNQIGSGGQNWVISGNWDWNGTSAITSLVILAGTGSLPTGTIMSIYGIKAA
jgi:hypothetical protein